MTRSLHQNTGRISRQSPAPWCLTLALALLSAVSLRADAPPTALHIARPVADTEGLATFRLDWDATSNATYLVQSATNLAPGATWTTLDAVTPVDQVGSYGVRVLTSSSTYLNQSPATFYRLILPQPQIFSVEPAIVAPGVAVDFFVFGQCFPTNAELQINGVTQSNAVFSSSSLAVNPSFTPNVPGTYRVTLVVGGVAVSAFTVVCADALVSPELVLQGPPTMEPMASPIALWLSKRGYDYWKAQSDMASASQGTESIGVTYLDKKLLKMVSGPPDSGKGINQPGLKRGISPVSAAFETQEGKKGLNAVNVKLARMAGGGGDSGSAPAKVAANRGDRDSKEGVVLAFSGEVQECAVDLAISGRELDFVWARTYRSRQTQGSTFGERWTGSYDVSVQPPASGACVVRDGTGRADTFKLQPNGTYTCPEFFREGTIINDTFTLTFADTGRWVFNPFDGSAAAGKLHQVITRNGSVMTLGYDTSGRLAQVVDDLDRTNTVAYNKAGQLTSVTDFSGRTVTYHYYTGSQNDPGGSPGDLKSVTSPPVTGTPNGNDFPDGKTTTYTYSTGYSDARENHLLLSAIDAEGQTTSQFVYQHNQTDLDFLRCVSVQRWTNAPSCYRWAILSRPPGSVATLKCIANDPVGNVTECFYDARNRCVMAREFTGRATPGLAVTDTQNRPTGKLRQTDPDYFETQCTWNNDSLCTAETSPGGQQVRCVYQSDFDPATPARKRADCRVVREIASSPVDLNGDGALDTSERVWSYQYDPRFGSPGNDYKIDTYTIPGGVLGTGRISHVGPDSGPSELRESPSKQPLGIRESPTEPSRGSMLRESPTLSRLRESPTKQSLDIRESPTEPSRGQTELRESPSKASLGFCTSATDPRGNVTTASYNASGDVQHIQRKHIGGIKYDDFVYDGHGQLTAITNAPDANGRSRVDTFAYAQGQMTQCVIDAGVGGLALTSSFEYDARGNMTRYVDPRGNDRLFAYNSLDQPVESSSATLSLCFCKIKVDYSYDANDQLVQRSTVVLDPAGNSQGTCAENYRYDSLHRLTRGVRAVDATHSLTNDFVYDANGQCVQALGGDAVSGADTFQKISFEYDECGLLFREIAAPGSPLQSTTQYDYDANGNPIRVSDGLEGTPSITTLEYDGFASGVRGGGKAQGVMGQKAKAWMVNNFEVHSLSGKKMMGAPKIGEATRCSKITDPMGNVSTFNYDANDNLKVIRHFGETNDVAGTNGNVRLAESRFEYDGLDQCTVLHELHFNPATQSPVSDGEATTRIAFAPNGDCSSVTDDLGLMTSFDYDTAGRAYKTRKVDTHTPPIGGIQAETSVIVCLRDRAGNVTSVTETNVSSFGGPAQVFACTYAYDELNRCVSATDSAGNTSSCAYDSLDHVVRVTDALGNDTTCAYDYADQILGCTAYAGSSSVPSPVIVRSSSATYDSNLRCTASTDANGNSTSYDYDTLGNCTTIRRPDGTQPHFVWSSRGNLMQATDPNGTVSVCTYDLNDRLVHRDITTGGGGGAGGATFFEAFSYDGCDRLTSHHDDDCDGDFTYDSLGNCVHETLNGLATTSTYDALGNRLSLAYPGGRVLAYAYDAASRCTGITESGATLASFAYTGSCLSRETCGNGGSSQFAYDGLVGTPNAAGDHGFGQVSQVRHTLANGSLVLSGCKVTWDQKQNKTARTVAIPGVGGHTNVMALDYDALDQLVQSVVLDGTTLLRNTTYGLDRMGNRTNVTGAACSGDYTMDSLLLTGLLDFQMNQYTTTPCDSRSYDDNGNLVSRVSAAGPVTYQYDYADRLVLVQALDLGTGTMAPLASYTYDALGRRVSKTVGSATTRQYCYAGDCVIEERENGAVIQSYVHATGLTDKIRENDAVVFEMRQGTQDYFVHTDDQGNTLALTGANGAVVERYDYDDYGAVTFLTSDGFPTSATSSVVGYLYCWGGLRLDAETGLQNDDGGGYFDPQAGVALPKLTPKIAKESHGKFRLPLLSNNPWSGGPPVEMKKGIVKFFNEAKGFGFIKAENGQEKHYITIPHNLQ